MISIIIATYNSEATLANALRSVLQQTYKEWECIIVDGASTDETLKIVLEYESIDSRFRHVSEPDKGIYDAFNKGWKMAKGEWIYYLGSDDELFPDALNSLMNASDNSMIVYGDMCYFRGTIEKYKQSPSNLSLGQMVSHQSMIMKKDVLKRFGGFDESYQICADKDLIQKCIQSKCTIKYANVFVAKFNISGVTGSKMDNLKEALAIDKKYNVAHPAILMFRYGKRYVKGYLRIQYYKYFQ